MLPIADGEILVRTACASICGSDRHGASFGVPPQPRARRPPGHESVGEMVDSRGPGVGPNDCALTVLTGG